MTHTLVFLARRIAAGAFTVWAMVTLAFWIFWAVPSEPANFVYPFQHLTDYQIRTAHHILGIDRPKIVQYGDYLWQLLHGNLGTSWATKAMLGNPRFTPPPGVHVRAPQLWTTLEPELGVTLSIMLGGALLVLLLAIPLGAIAGSRIGSLTDRTISLVALIGVTTHPMLVGILLRSLFGGRLHWAPTGGYCALFPSTLHPPPGVIISPRVHVGACGGVVDWASHLALPWLTFALLFLALYTRMVRSSVAETLPEDFVRTARAKGAGETRVLGIHVLPNAALRVLTMVGMEIGTVIGVSVYIETAYGLDGLGRAGVFAMIGQFNGLDLPLILAIVTVISLIVVIGNLVVDTLYAFVDPRASLGIERTGSKSLAGGVI